MNRRLRNGIAVAATPLWLTAVWALLWGGVAPGTLAAGLLVSLGVLFLLPLPGVSEDYRPHVGALLLLVVMMAWYVVRASAEIAWISVRPSPPPRAGVLRAPLRIRTDFVLALAVMALNLIPGGTVVEIDHHRRVVYVHVLDSGSDRARATFRRQTARLERQFIAAFEKKTGREAAA